MSCGKVNRYFERLNVVHNRFLTFIKIDDTFCSHGVLFSLRSEIIQKG